VSIQEDSEKMNQVRMDSSSTWDHGSHEEFYEYYSKESLTLRSRERFRAIRDAVLRVDKRPGGFIYDVADIGCGAGTQSMLWAELGHRVHGLDVNEPLLDLARERSATAGFQIEFVTGSAVSLPWPDESMDACLAVELLEHVADSQTCLKEFSRVLRPGGILFLSTSNKLCPIQHEFNLPMYSWYPRPIKRYCERLAVTTRPQLANYAKYPAVNWFSFYDLRRQLGPNKFKFLDRFDLIDTENRGMIPTAIVTALRAVPPLRWFGHVLTPGTTVLAVKK
jgi:2-polyprenyl-6-hydroxyphenyl methylase/3-demethylubiquinone-9 3-methyltransferase